MARSHTPCSPASNGSRSNRPAKWISAPTGPPAASSAAAHASGVSSEDCNVAMRAVPSVSRACASRSSSMSTSTQWAPCASIVRAVSTPIPPAPPVMTMRLPANSATALAPSIAQIAIQHAASPQRQATILVQGGPHCGLCGRDARRGVFCKCRDAGTQILTQDARRQCGLDVSGPLIA